MLLLTVLHKNNLLVILLLEIDVAKMMLLLDLIVLMWIVQYLELVNVWINHHVKMTIITSVLSQVNVNI